MNSDVLEIKHYSKSIKWVNGVPQPAYREIISRESVGDLPLVTLSLPYERTPSEIIDDIDKDLEGLTNAEVIMIRITRQAAHGDQDAVKILLDRILGKPKQSIETKTLALNYQDYLEELARRESLANPKEKNDYGL